MFQMSTKEKEPKNEKQKSKVAGWSTEKMEEKASKQVEEAVGKLREKCWRSTKWRSATRIIQRKR